MRYPDLPESLGTLEETLLAQWRDEDLFEATQRANAEGAPFVFYEGPPTANGRPGLHHIISRTVKDLVCRYRSMQGRSVTRIAGWDTHGLPVEIEAEKKLGISGKPDIEAVGIARFNEVCRDSVFTYKEEWERLSERIAYWLDYSNPYVTFHTEYIESVWAILKQLNEKGLIYRGHKSVPYCPRCGTTLSSHEVAQGYRDIPDPSLYFLCDWVDAEGAPDPEGRTFMAWTTTPWTVPSNTALAVNADLPYVEVAWEGRRVVIAEDRLEALFGEGAEVLRRHSGAELVGQRYSRPLEIVPVPEEDRPLAWRVVAEDFVSAEDGTGIVHMAPAFGADDFAAGERHGFPLLRPVDDRGCFREEIPIVGGRFVKEADPALVEALRDRDRLFRIDEIEHSYPHCWRCSSPLIYMARDSWFARTSTLKDSMLRNNAAINWLPPEVGEGRMGEWLANNVDWALSRDRFWGTPVPVWVNDEDPGEVEWIGSLEALDRKVGGLPEDFDPHRPFIDELTWPAPGGTGTMRRDPAVLDVWFDSGAMPYAQWHWPHENDESFERHFPADFISEGLDQTRGWFYSLLAISTMLERGPAYRNVIVNGLILDADGQKMSKSKGNTVNPWEAIEEFGSDPLRWYMVTVSNPWAAKRYDPEGVREASRKLFDTLLNTYRFFALYANVEDWQPGELDPAPEDRSLLDRWLLSRLHRTVAAVDADLDEYQLTRGYRLVVDFLNEDLSNWFVRRSRARFWGNGDADDTRAAFRTLWEALTVSARLLGPITPFFADWLHRALTEGQSVHLTRFPVADEGRFEERLEEEMAGVRALVSLGRAAREDVRIRVRQPLRTLYAVLPEGQRPRDEVLAVLKDELNVKEVSFLDSAEELVRLAARPRFQVLGPHFKQNSQEAGDTIRELQAEKLEAFRRGEPVSISVGGDDVLLQPDWLDVVEEAAGALVVKSEEGYTAALDPTLDEELRTEGMARELVNRIQRLRKDAGLEITDRIDLAIEGPEEVSRALETYREFITGETLALSLAEGGASASGYADALSDEVDGIPIRVALRRAGPT
ncbi:MAG: isoleucine--tRNA ligase [Gemmatimonadales bacterium]|nr:MAG: isoleucine--tRNA ligase [Gemmatimonadales bacterium]